MRPIVFVLTKFTACSGAGNRQSSQDMCIGYAHAAKPSIGALSSIVLIRCLQDVRTLMCDIAE